MRSDLVALYPWGRHRPCKQKRIAHTLKHFQYVAARTGNARDIFGTRIRQQWPKIFTYSLIETFFGAAVKKKQDLMLKMYFPPEKKKNMYPPLVF